MPSSIIVCIDRSKIFIKERKREREKQDGHVNILTMIVIHSFMMDPYSTSTCLLFHVIFSCSTTHTFYECSTLCPHSHGSTALLSSLSSTTMPLIVLTGHPCSGKSQRANQIKQYMLQRLSADGRSMRIHIINDDSLNVSKEAYRGRYI